MARNSVRLFSLKNTKSFKTKTRQEERKEKKKSKQITLAGFWHNHMECDRLYSALWLLKPK